MVRNATFWDKFWRDKYGRDVIWQKPNLFLSTWFIATVFTWFLPFVGIKRGLGVIATVALLTWSLLEIGKGVNYFRRLIGFLILVILIINRLH